MDITMNPTLARLRVIGSAILLAILMLVLWSFVAPQVFAQPPVPHPVGGNEDCLSCHETGESGAPQFPEDHEGRNNDSCIMCHAEAGGPPPPTVPHALEGREDCLACHETGAGGATVIPDDHEGRSSESCQVCHKAPAAEEGEAAPMIPHSIEGRENCVNCHVPTAEGDVEETEAVPTDAPVATPPPDLIQHPELAGDVSTCFSCHIEQEGRGGAVATDWEESIHAKRGVLCVDCHGGDPNATSMEEAKSADAGFIGAPDRTEIPDLCGSCHSNVTLMRQYDLPTDQLAKYRESFHGQQLEAGDTKVATCYDCHDGHATRETNNPQASVYILNVPELCASCHADEDYMAEYSIPTDQYALYEDSVHGIALLEHQDTRAPSCATCHGTHGAAPPGFSEVANVCGSCHGATQDYYLEGTHSADNPDAPRCVTCHGRYDVTEPSEDMFIGDEPRHCGSCHEEGSAAQETVTEIYESLVAADEALEGARGAVEDAARVGMIVAAEEGLLADARTHLITARAAQHRVDLEIVREETVTSVELSEQAQQQAEQAIAESRFRRFAMGIALGVIALIIFSLVMLRRELIRRSSDG